MHKIYTGDVNLTNITYENCSTITQVDLMQTPWVNNDMNNAFANCTNLHTVTNIEANVNTLVNAFYNCQNLVNAPDLPPATNDLFCTFYNCTNLVNVPAIPPNTQSLCGTFQGCCNIITVPTIPDSINNLDSAFYGCTKLTTVPSLENVLTNSSYPFVLGTFSGCTSLTTQPILPKVTTLLDRAFLGCSNLTNINVPTNVTNMHETYYGCSNLTTIPNISHSIVNMNHTFGACVNISGDINILSDKINDVANIFNETSARKNVYIPPVQYNDTSINSPTYNAFIAAGYDELGTKDGVYLMYNYYPAKSSDWITSVAANNSIVLEQYIGSNTSVITPHTDWYSNKVLNGSTAYANNINIVNIDLADVEVIDNNLGSAFYNCSSLEGVTNLNQSITNTSWCFYNCQNLNQTPIIPSNTTNMAGMFDLCKSLTTAPTIPYGVVDMYQSFASCYNITEMPIIPNSVTNIAQAFMFNPNLTNAPIIPDSVVDMQGTFYNCQSLINVPDLNLPNCLILRNCFNGCSSLTDINISTPNCMNITNIFDHCTNLKNVYAEFNSVTNIDNAFENSKSLQSVNLAIQNALTARSTFRNCDDLTTVVWNATALTDISSCFRQCDKLIAAPTIPATATNMFWTFAQCYELTDAPTIPSSVTSLAYTFYACNKLVNVPSLSSATELTSLSGTFNNCSSLVDAPALPSTLTNMTDTFANCTSLVNAPTIPQNVIVLINTFHNCQSLITPPDLPSNVQYLRATFSGCNNLTSAPVIPASVVSLQGYTTYGSNPKGCFSKCTSLTGNIYIHSNQITNADNCFYGTTAIKNVYIPFEYENGVATTTYNSFNTAYPINTVSGTIHNGVTDNNGIISNFSENNYLWVEQTVPTPITEIEEVIKIHTNSITPSDPTYDKQCIVAGEPYKGIASIHLYQDGKFQIYISSNGTSNSIADGIFSTLTVNANTDYWIKFTWNSSTYKLSVSTDGTNYTDYIEVSSSLPPAFNGKIAFGTDTGATIHKPFLGTIDLRNSYIKINNQDYWKGYVRPNGVVLKDIDGDKISIHPTPDDALVQMRDVTAGTEISLDDWSYIGSSGSAEIQGYNGSDTAVVVPSLFETRRSMRAIEGHVIEYIVSKEGYKTVTGTHTVSGTEIINVNLERIMCTITINPIPLDATVTLTTNATLYCWYSGDLGYYLYTLSENINVGDTLYYLSLIPAGTITEITSATTFSALVHGISEDFGRQSSMDSDYLQSGNSITVPWGTEVTYTVSKAHYQTVTGTHVAKVSGCIGIQLARDQHTFTITPTPNDAAVQILVNGRLVNATNSDWTFTANNVNGDIELQTYTGSNTVVTMPTSFTTTNSITASYGDTIEWKVSKEHYHSQTGTLTLTEDTEIEISLIEIIYRLDVGDYTYTDNSGVVTLTQYTGIGGPVDTPEVEEI